MQMQSTEVRCILFPLVYCFLKEPEFRVFVLLMYSDHARDLLCEVRYHIIHAYIML